MELPISRKRSLASNSVLNHSQLPMDDEWPTIDDLTLDDFHWIWKFRPDHSDHNLVHLLLESPEPLYHELVLHQDCVPQLACFDLEYWDAMTLNADHDDHAAWLRMTMKQKYLQKVRIRIVNTLSQAQNGALVDRPSVVDIAHMWSIRSVNNFTHSPFGRQEYEKRCQRKQQVPYQQKLTQEGDVLASKCMKSSSHHISSFRLENILPRERQEVHLGAKSGQRSIYDTVGQSSLDVCRGLVENEKIPTFLA